MKKLITMLCLIALITGCEKENPIEDKVFELNVPEFVGYIDKTPEQIKSSIKYEFVDETNTLGVVELKYRLKTKDDTYAVYFKANSDGIVKNIKLNTSFTSSASDAINHVKSLTDIINKSYSDKFYIGNYYNNIHTNPGTFNDRNKFWQYIAEHVNGINRIEEKWLLKNGEVIADQLVYLNLECNYDFSNKTFTIEIIKNEY